MPRIKRWFPVSHDINADPEVWAMRRQIGEKSLSIWLELLSISDRNDGELRGDYQELIRSVSGRCQATVRSVSAVLEFAKSKLWVTCDPTLRVVNYAKYHKTRETKEIPSGIQKGSLPSEPSEPSEPKECKTASPSAGLLAKETENIQRKDFVTDPLDRAVKFAADAVYNQDRPKFARLVVWIRQADKNGRSKASQIKALQDFLPYAREVTDWWPYLDKLIEKADSKITSQNHEEAHFKRKADEAKIPAHLKTVLSSMGGKANANAKA